MLIIIKYYTNNYNNDQYTNNNEKIINGNFSKYEMCREGSSEGIRAILTSLQLMVNVLYHYAGFILVTHGQSNAQ